MTRKFSHQMFFVGYLFIIYLFIYLFVYLFIYLFVYLFIYLFVLFIYLFIYSFIYLFILAKINSNEAPLFCRKMDPTHLTAMCVKTCQNSQGNTCVGVSF